MNQDFVVPMTWKRKFCESQDCCRQKKSFIFELVLCYRLRSEDERRSERVMNWVNSRLGSLEASWVSDFAPDQCS